MFDGADEIFKLYMRFLLGFGRKWFFLFVFYESLSFFKHLDRLQSQITQIPFCQRQHNELNMLEYHNLVDIKAADVTEVLPGFVLKAKSNIDQLNRAEEDEFANFELKVWQVVASIHFNVAVEVLDFSNVVEEVQLEFFHAEHEPCRKQWLGRDEGFFPLLKPRLTQFLRLMWFFCEALGRWQYRKLFIFSSDRLNFMKKVCPVDCADNVFDMALE